MGATQPYAQQLAPAARPATRVLVIATDELTGPALVDELRNRLAPEDETEVMVIVPAVEQPRLRRLLGQVDPSADEAASSLARALGELGQAGIPARGDIGDSDPLIAAEEALREFAADEILLTEKARTHGPQRAHRRRAQSRRHAGLPPRRSH
jgi:hypothetical protein